MADPHHPSDPHRVPVLIAEARRDLLGALLESAVAHHAGMILLDRVLPSRAGAVLKWQGGRCVLLLLGEGNAHRAAAARFLKQYPDLVVIRVEMPQVGIAISLRQIGLDQLLETICTLGQVGASGDGIGRRLEQGGGHA